MRKSFVPALIVLISLLLFPACKQEKKPRPTTWMTYSEMHRHTAHLNGMPYWNDIFKECFPDTLGTKKLDRIELRRMDKAIPVLFYDVVGTKLNLKTRKVPEEFGGYLVRLSYEDEDDKYPLELAMFFSRVGTQKWKRDIDASTRLEMKTIGEFTTYEGWIKGSPMPAIWAFFDDYLCFYHPVEDIHYKVSNSELFYDLITDLDPECLRNQLPSF